MELERKENKQQPMIKSIFIQDIMMKDFMIIDSGRKSKQEYTIKSYYKPTDETEVFYECLLPIKLAENETFYIKQLDKYVEIDRYIIKDDGVITYYIKEAKVKNKHDSIPEWMKFVCNKLYIEIEKSERIKEITEDRFKPFKLRRIKKELYK